MHGTPVPARALTSSTRSASEGPAGTRRHPRGARVAVRAGEPVEIVADTLFATTTRSLTEGQRAARCSGQTGGRGEGQVPTLSRLSAKQTDDDAAREKRRSARTGKGSRGSDDPISLVEAERRRRECTPSR